jgi:hypothetical protein
MVDATNILISGKLGESENQMVLYLNWPGLKIYEAHQGILQADIRRVSFI